MTDIIKQIYDVIKDAGFKVYFPSQHKGECTSKFVVVKQSGVYKPLTVSTERPIYTIMCYVPQNNYSDLEKMIRVVKQNMRKLFPMLFYIGNETESFYDEDIKAHMVSFQYYGERKLINR
nr:MAG TPA: tail completion protein [Caudoviricetes sp.]